MAKRQTIQMFDDLDGQAIDDDGETISFGLEGKSYEIDLSSEDAEVLRTALEPFVRSARRMKSK